MVSRSPAARRDIVDLAVYISKNSIDAANRFLDAVEETFRFLSHNPEAGELCRFRDPRAQSVRAWRVHGFRNHVVLYRPSENGVNILRVLHGARDVDSLFAPD
jgi:toxin ParE1/3/4